MIKGGGGVHSHVIFLMVLLISKNEETVIRQTTDLEGFGVAVKK